MPRKPSYGASVLQAALQELSSGQSSLNSISNKYGIPKSTLLFRKQHPGQKEKFGPPPVLTGEEEATLVNWILELSRKGFPRKKEDIISSVQKCLQNNPRPNPFKDNRPGNGWIKAFLKRNPQISQRTSEGVTSASSCLSETDIRKWFDEIGNYIKERQLDEVINDPSRVFNGDESGFQICPSTGRVLAEKGAKNVYSIEQGSSKENITAMFTFSASGATCCPMVVYPYKRIPDQIARSVPDHWGIARSDNGWMTGEVFYEYIANVFHPYLIKEKVPLPIILFVDGHKSHLTYHLSVLCSELQIEIIALYPNATRILQPCDVAVFRPIKIAWRKAVKHWQDAHPGEALNKLTFAPLLQTVVESSVKRATLINGFRVCGIFPFNADAIDYTKCLASSKPVAADHEKQTAKEDDINMSYDTFSRIVGEDKLKKFQAIGELLCEESNSDDFLDLYRIWNYFQGSHNVNIKDTALIPYPLSECVSDYVNEIQDLDENEQIHFEAKESEEIQMQPDPSEPSCSHSTFLKPSVEMIQPSSSQLCKPSCSRSNSSPPLVGIKEPSPLSSFLMWPNSPKRKGKRQIQRVPYAIASNQFKQMMELKQALKLQNEQEKVDRKRKREEKLKEKAIKNSKIKKQNDAKKNVCGVCSKIIKANDIKCSQCYKGFHKSCIPSSHKKHIPMEDDDDMFLCHFCYAEESEEEAVLSPDEGSRDVDELFQLYQDEKKKLGF